MKSNVTDFISYCKCKLGKKISSEEPKKYTSLSQFLREHPINPEANTQYLQEVYWDLYTNVRDADLPQTERPIRSNLLVSLGIKSGIIHFNKEIRI